LNKITSIWLFSWGGKGNLITQSWHKRIGNRIIGNVINKNKKDLRTYLDLRCKRKKIILCLIGGCESPNLMILQAPQPLILNSLKSIIVERRLFKIYNHWQRFVKSHNYWETVHAPGVVRKALTVEKRPSPNTEEKLNHHRWCRTLHQDGHSICKFQKSLIRTKKKKKKTTGPNKCLSTVALVYLFIFFKKSSWCSYCPQVQWWSFLCFWVSSLNCLCTLKEQVEHGQEIC
jgi:hypothetical protein